MKNTFFIAVVAFLSGALIVALKDDYTKPMVVAASVRSVETQKPKELADSSVARVQQPETVAEPMPSTTTAMKPVYDLFTPVIPPKTSTNNHEVVFRERDREWFDIWNFDGDTVFNGSNKGHITRHEGYYVIDFEQNNHYYVGYGNKLYVWRTKATHDLYDGDVTTAWQTINIRRTK